MSMMSIEEKIPSIPILVALPRAEAILVLAIPLQN